MCVCVCYIGPYLDDEETREKFSDAYRAMTDAFLAFPLCVPGTAVWKGYKVRAHTHMERETRGCYVTRCVSVVTGVAEAHRAVNISVRAGISGLMCVRVSVCVCVCVVQGRLFIIKVLSEAAARSKKRMAAGHEPECLLDFWSQQVRTRYSENTDVHSTLTQSGTDCPLGSTG